MISKKTLRLFFLIFFFFSNPSFANSLSSLLEVKPLTLWWALPFGMVLGSLALFPLLASQMWHQHYGKIIHFFTLCLFIAFTSQYGFSITFCTFLDITLHHYLPFILLIMALYVAAGGININLQAAPSARTNTLVLAVATFVAGWVGTTGAAVLFIRPFLKMNEHRLHRQHLVIFFILLVCNIGGGLTPLGDPPLFLGYLEGIDFSWPLRHMTLPLLFLMIPLLCIFYIWDRMQQESIVFDKKMSIEIKGKENLYYLGTIILIILLTGTWKYEKAFHFLNLSWKIKDVLRELGLLIIIFLSYFTTNSEPRRANEFTWAPLQEVALLFAAIFFTAAPVLEMLKARENGPFQPLLHLITAPDGTLSPFHYFWACGLLSSFLDNAPTYLVFFNLAGGNTHTLMNTLHPILLAISTGSVFMGAMTYIGNAPNFMVKSISESHDIQMPGFFKYCLYAVLLLLPLLILMTFIFF